jgi:hypothetical protein
MESLMTVGLLIVGCGTRGAGTDGSVCAILVAVVGGGRGGIRGRVA